MSSASPAPAPQGLRRLLHGAMRRSRELAIPQAAVDIQDAIDRGELFDGAVIALIVLRRYDPANTLIVLIEASCADND